MAPGEGDKMSGPEVSRLQADAITSAKRIRNLERVVRLLAVGLLFALCGLAGGWLTFWRNQ